jgi:hypothetical protein
MAVEQPSSKTTERVERFDTGVSIEVAMTRGNGTRDQDKIKAKVKAETLDEAREDMDSLREYLNEFAQQCREIQPDEEGEDEE